MADDTAKKGFISEKDLEVGPVTGFDLSDIISQTIQKTIEGLAPYLGKSPSGTTVKEESTNLRERILKEMNNDFDHVLNANKRFMGQLANTPKSEMVMVQIPRVYAKYLGSVLPVGLNGSVIAIPIDNKPYLIPKRMKEIVDKTLAYEDEKISFMERTGNSDVTETTQDRLKV